MQTVLVASLLALGALAAVPSASAIEANPLDCGSSVGVCVTNHTPAGQCVLVHVGLQGGGACVDQDPLAVRVCTSMHTTVFETNCPTDGLATDLTP